MCVCVWGGGGGGGGGGVLDTSLCGWLDTSLFYFNLHVSLPFTFYLLPRYFVVWVARYFVVLF